MKANRKLIFDKFGGKCAYCGCELDSRFHVDEILPIIRLTKWVDGYYKHNETSEIVTKENIFKIQNRRDYSYIQGKSVPNGCKYPERKNIENQYPACASCNIDKGSSTLEEWRLELQKSIKTLNDKSIYRIAKRYGLIEETNKKIIFYFEKFNQ